MVADPSGPESDPSNRHATLPPRGARKHVASGEFIEWAGQHELSVQAPRQKAGWHGGHPGDQIRPAFPGTAVSIDGQLFEVTAHQQLGQTNHYRLEPWDPRHPVRGTPVEFSRAAVHAERAAEREHATANAMHDRLVLFGVLVALLPRSEQERLDQRYGFDGAGWTRRSALLIKILLLAWLVIIFATLFPGGRSFEYLLFIIIFMIEQFFRRAKALVGEPCGSLLALPLIPVLAWWRNRSEPKQL